MNKFKTDVSIKADQETGRIEVILKMSNLDEDDLDWVIDNLMPALHRRYQLPQDIKDRWEMEQQEALGWKKKYEEDR